MRLQDPHVKLMAAALERGGAGAAQSALPRKRSLLDAIAGDEPTLHIQVACGARIAAHRELLSFFSSCVKGLPAGAADWDVSGLLLDGRPASRAVVAAWLEEAYAGSSYADTKTAAATERAAGGEEEAVDPIDLLMFADAVGSSAHVYQRCYERCADALGALNMVIGGTQITMELNRGRYMYGQDGYLYEHHSVFSRQRLGAEDGVRSELRAQVAAQLEWRLYAAYRLGLPGLEDKVHAFIKANTSEERDSVFTPEALDEAMLSQRVVAAAAGDVRRMRRALAACILSGAPAR
jgi:hypothetical protein